MSDLERYGLNWRDKLAPVAQPMADGYWTPWHVADAEITRLQAENEDLREQLKRQAKAAQMGMDAAKQAGESMYRHGEKMLSESNPEALENERAANALLTEENEVLRARCATVTELADKLAEAIKLDLQAVTTDEKRAADETVFTAHEDYLVFREHDPDNEAKARDFRKQAEAVDWAWHKYCRESASEDCKVLYQDDMEDAVKALRQQSAALERQSVEGGPES